MNLLKSKQITLEFQSDPKKFKKYHKIKYKTINCSTTIKDNFGLYFGIKRHTYLTTKQILTILKLLKPGLKKFKMSRISSNINVDTTITKKPKDIRMGRGKGAPSEKVFCARAGSPVLSLYGLPRIEAKRNIVACLPKIAKAVWINKYNW